jgi:hypothetical protein
MAYRATAFVGGLRGLVQQDIELLAGTENGLQREHWESCQPSRKDGTRANYDG